MGKNQPSGTDAATMEAEQSPVPPPRLGTIRLKEGVELPGSERLRFSRTDTLQGEVAFGLDGHPVGVYVEVKDTARAHLANINRHFIPASNCKSITLKKATRVADE
jgi:hypothetical protein